MITQDYPTRLPKTADAAVPPCDHTGRHSTLRAAACATFAATGMVLALVMTRQFFTYGTETDYISSFVPEAQRLLRGESLRLSFHPPMYAIAIAAVQLTVQDWFVTGLALSLAASAGVLFTQFVFFDRLIGRPAAWGAFAALATSRVFLTFSSLATSDMFFLALYSFSLLFALIAVTRDKARWWWLGLGALLGITLLTRTNGVTLLVLLAAPFLRGESLRRSFAHGSIIVGGLALVLAGWTVFATLTNSAFSPGKTHANLAMTYYGGGDRVSAEARLPMEREFGSLSDVVLRNPAGLAAMYLRDLARLPGKVFRSKLVAFPIAALGLFGLILLFCTDLTWMKAGFSAVVLAQILLVNMKTFEERYYLFLVPVIGAGAGLAMTTLHRQLTDRRLRIGAYAGLTGLVLVSFIASLRGTARSIRSENLELGSFIHSTRGMIKPDALVISRKTHLAYYSRCASVYMPNAATVSELGQYILTHPPSRPLYVFYGSHELFMRPQLSELATPAAAPSWLEVVAAREESPRWALYKVNRVVLLSSPEIMENRRAVNLPQYTVIDWSDLGVQRFE